MVGNTKLAESRPITRLIDEWRKGNREAEGALFAALYNTLYAIALRCMRNETPGGSLGPTALVHEAYLRFVKAENISVSGRAHFLALSAQVMRRILVDRARARRASKRDGGFSQHDVIDLIPTDRDADQILAVDRAMESLSKDFPEGSKLVELRWFAGYSEDECAEILSVSSRTVRRRWQIARTRLKMLIDGSGSESEW
jgi:RNA polymerase sigma-70 factor, ECF subfamily